MSHTLYAVRLPYRLHQHRSYHLQDFCRLNDPVSMNLGFGNCYGPRTESQGVHPWFLSARTSPAAPSVPVKHWPDTMRVRQELLASIFRFERVAQDTYRFSLIFGQCQFFFYRTYPPHICGNLNNGILFGGQVVSQISGALQEFLGKTLRISSLHHRFVAAGESLSRFFTLSLRSHGKRVSAAFSNISLQVLALSLSTTTYKF